MRVRIDTPNDRAIQKAGEIVRKGGVIIFPTDTLYGIGCDPMRREAVRRVLAAKRRGGKPMPVLLSSTEEARAFVELGWRGEALASRFWPGPLTIVAPVKLDLPEELTGGRGKIGVRVPAHTLLLAIISASGGALVGTSANISGGKAARSVEELDPELVKGADLVVDGGASPLGKPSTVVEIGEPEPEGVQKIADGVWIIREGGVGTEELKAALRGKGVG